MATITELGKFEGEPTYAPHFWDAVLNGDGDTVEGTDGITYSILGVDPADVTLFPDLDGVDVIVLWESTQGFVYTREMTHRQAEAFRRELGRGSRRVIVSLIGDTRRSDRAEEKQDIMDADRLRPTVRHGCSRGRRSEG